MSQVDAGSDAKTLSKALAPVRFAGKTSRFVATASKQFGATLKAAWDNDGYTPLTSDPTYPASHNIDPRNYDPDNGIQLSPVFGAVDLITRNVKTATLELQELAGGRWKPMPIKQGPRWMTRPNNHQSVPDFLDCLCRNFLIGGNGFNKILLFDGGVPDIIYSVPTYLVSIDQTVSSVLASGGVVEYHVNGQPTRPFTIYEPTGGVQHLKYATFRDSLWGTSPLVTCAPSVRSALAADAYAELFFESGGIPPVFYFRKDVAPDSPNETTIGEFAQKFAEIRANPEKRHLPIFHAGDWAAIETAMPPDQMQLLDARVFTSRGAAAKYGVPRPLIGGDDSAAWANGSRQLVRLYYNLTLAGHLYYFSMFLSELLPDDMRAVLKQDHLLEADPLENARFWERLVLDGIARPAEARVPLGLEYDETVNDLVAPRDPQQRDRANDGGDSDSGRDTGQENFVENQAKFVRTNGAAQADFELDVEKLRDAVFSW